MHAVRLILYPDPSCAASAIPRLPAFSNVVESKRTLREIKLLRHFNHENIISLRDILRPESKETFEDIYLVSELLDTDLHQYVSCVLGPMKMLRRINYTLSFSRFTIRSITQNHHLAAAADE